MTIDLEGIQFDTKPTTPLEQKLADLAIKQQHQIAGLQQEIESLQPNVVEVLLKENYSNIKIHGGLLTLFANSFVDTFEDQGAVNYLEMTFRHRASGEEYTLLMQKKSGLTQGDKNEELMKHLAEAEQKIKNCIEKASNYASYDGAHHKNWVINEMLKCLMSDKELQDNGWKDEDWLEECIAP